MPRTSMMRRPFLRLTMSDCLPDAPERSSSPSRLAIPAASTAAVSTSPVLLLISLVLLMISLMLMVILSEPACRLDDTCLGKGVRNPTGDRAPGGPRLAVRPRRPPGYLPLRGVSSG